MTRTPASRGTHQDVDAGLWAIQGRRLPIFESGYKPPSRNSSSHSILSFSILEYMILGDRQKHPGGVGPHVLRVAIRER